jgi:hypothetical protein
MSDLPSMITQVKIEEDLALYEEHMVVVGGWRAFAYFDCRITALR